MIHCVRTSSDDEDFIRLVKELDVDLSIRDGDEHAFYDQYNKIDSINYVVMAYIDVLPVGCGAIKEYATSTMEIKRMYVIPEQRGQGIASVILKELEHWTKELKFERCILETGIRQPEAIALYKKNGYVLTENYGQYTHAKNSVCFEKYM